MSPSDIKIVAVAICVVASFGIYRFIRRFQALVPSPDPWSDEIQAAVCDESATPICHHCLTPHHPNTWFCPKCGTAVGAYNNFMPWVHVFSEGEVLRNSLYDRLRVNVMTITGFFIFTIALGILTGFGLILMPLMWVMFVKNVVRSRTLEAEEKISNANQTSL